MGDSRVEKWKGWLEEAENDLIGVAWNRAVYRELGRIVDENPEIPPSLFFDFLGETYVTTQAASVRRQAERGHRVISFGALLEEISEDPGRLTRDLYLSHAGDDDARQQAAHDWDEQFGGSVGDHLDPTIVEHDLAELGVAVEPIKVYTDQHVAHRDRKYSEPPTFGELDAAIDAFEKLVYKYGNLLRGSGIPNLEPTPQENWTEVFRVPWIKDDPT